MEKENIGRLVWAKIRYSPYWPAKIVETPPELRKKSREKKICVLFFGTKNYGFLANKSIVDYIKNREIYSNKSKAIDFQRAVNKMDDYIRDPEKNCRNGQIHKINANFEIKIEEEAEENHEVKPPSVQTKVQTNSNQVNDRLLAELVTLREKYNKTYFELDQGKALLDKLQKERDLSTQKLIEAMELKANVELQNKKLLEQLANANNKINSLRTDKSDIDAQLEATKNNVATLNKQNKLLQARFTQFRRGIDHKPAQSKIDHHSKTPSKLNLIHVKKSRKKSKDNESNEFEVEKILNHKNKWKTRYFLVRWKNYDQSHDTWEREDNLSCPKILNKYFKSKKIQ